MIQDIKQFCTLYTMRQEHKHVYRYNKIKHSLPRKESSNFIKDVVNRV